MRKILTFKLEVPFWELLLIQLSLSVNLICWIYIGVSK